MPVRPFVFSCDAHIAEPADLFTASMTGDLAAHAIHAEEGIDCTDCHPGAEDGDEPGMPARATCQLCHSDLDEEKPEEKRADGFSPESQLFASHSSARGTEVRFSHATHAAAAAAIAGHFVDIREWS